MISLNEPEFRIHSGSCYLPVFSTSQVSDESDQSSSHGQTDQYARNLDCFLQQDIYFFTRTLTGGRGSDLKACDTTFTQDPVIVHGKVLLVLVPSHSSSFLQSSPGTTPFQLC